MAVAEVRADRQGIDLVPDREGAVYARVAERGHRIDRQPRVPV